jgi:hypothetical protein
VGYVEDDFEVRTPLADFFSLLLGAFSRQIAHNPFGRYCPVTDTVRNPDATITGAGED